MVTKVSIYDVYNVKRVGSCVAIAIDVGNKCIVVWPTSVTVYDSLKDAKDGWDDVEFVPRDPHQETKARATRDAVQDSLEGCPMSSIVGPDRRLEDVNQLLQQFRVPYYISQGYSLSYLLAYLEANRSIITSIDPDPKPRATTDGKPPDDDMLEGPAPKPVDRETGQHGAYWVLPEEERKKGFVRPYRDTYIHVGRRATGTLRDLTDEEKEQHSGFGYVKCEDYPESESPKTGRFWTQDDLDRLNCLGRTTMGRALAETYARDPSYYGGTYCCKCGSHFPVEEFVWLDGSRVGT